MNSILVDIHYWPCIHYCQSVFNAEVVQFDDSYQLQRHSFQNNCIINSSNGALNLKIPVKGGLRNAGPLNEVQISYDTKWQREHWHAIKTSYAKSAYFEFYELELEAIYTKQESSLLNFNQKIFSWIQDQIGLQVKNESASDQNNSEDQRNSFNTRTYQNHSVAAYFQLFIDQHPFLHNLSVLDLFMSLGPEVKNYLSKSS